MSFDIGISSQFNESYRIKYGTFSRPKFFIIPVSIFIEVIKYFIGQLMDAA